jgi:hypothetical protein
MHKIERRECLILAFPVQRRLIAELPVWHNVHMRFSSHAKVRRENEQVPAHQNRRSTRNTATPTIWSAAIRQPPPMREDQKALRKGRVVALSPRRGLRPTERTRRI